MNFSKKLKSKLPIRLWYLTIKNIKTMFRDKIQLIWIFGYPLAFISIFFLAFGSVSSREVYNIVIINNDIEGVLNPEGSAQANASLLLEDILESDDLEEFVKVVGDEDDYDYDEAYELIQTNEIDAIVEIDDMFSESIYYLQQAPEVEVTCVPDEVTEGVMDTLISQVVDKISMKIYNVTSADIDTDQIIDSKELAAFDYIVPGFIIASVLVCISQISAHFAEEKENQTIQRLITTPASKRDIVLSGMLAQLFVAAIQVILMLFISIVFFDAYVHPDANLFLLFSISLLFAFTALGFGLLLASFVKTAGSAGGLAWLIILPLQFLGGVYFPFDNPIMNFIPTYYASHAMEIIMLNGQSSWSAIGIDILVLTGFGVGLTLLGIILFERSSSIY
ncbi:MAG: ABC transporter permease subunit [Candidatus Lokiarchaeota archaeon]|nr:ABC transporter permease subunit [Candidatus Lokiarchaeota archaeon]